MIRFARGPGVGSAAIAAAAARTGLVPEVPPDADWDVPGPAVRTRGYRSGDHARLRSPDPEAIRAARAAGARVWVVAGTVPAVAAAAEAGADLWLRGLEAAVEEDDDADATALILIRAAAATGRAWVAEGLGPRAMAAAVAVGAAGVVVDAPLWLCAGSALSAERRAVVRGARSVHDTVLVGELGERRRRVLTRGGVAVPAPQDVAGAVAHDGDDPVAVALAVVRDVEARVERIRAVPPPGDPLGTGHPVVCGPMANVAEHTALARAVRAAGGMPFAALGALDPAQANAVLEAWVRDVPRPFGVGVIGFDVMPFRDAHLDAVVAVAGAGTPVTLAGGNVALAGAVARRGLVPWLHAPSAALCRAALAAGIPGIVLEGHEAGGHVGRATSAGLWEEALAEVEAAGGATVVALAGGIGDRVSAAFARAMGADAAAAGARVVVQAGTAFLLTHEAADGGQVTLLYQAQALEARTTVLVGSTVNLPLRCVPNRFTDRARALEQRWEAERMPRGERRARLEHHNLGRTRIAAKGIERDDSGQARYRPVPAARQRDEGAFTVGQGATVTARVASVAEVIAALAPPAPATGSRWGAVSRVVVPARPRAPVARGDVAVIGLGCVLPGALDVPAFFRNLVEGVDAVGPIPDARWRAERYYAPDAARGAAARTYARHAGVVRGFRFDPVPFRIPPKVVPSMDPSQRMALVAAAEAVRGAGLDRAGRVDPRRAGVVLGNAMGGEFAKSAALRVRFREVIDAVAEDERLGGWTVEDLAALEDRVEARLAERLPPVDVDSMAGLLSNVVAGRVAAWLDWMGGNLTVDAACAASLAAVSVAVDWLRLGRCDVVLAGGVDTDLAPETYVGFCRTHALSATGSSPFSAHADGFVMGEGAVVLALKRAEDAVRDGDPVWALIRGVGTSSDGRGRGITAPRAEGQALAIERAYREAGFGPDGIGLVEAHGTGTALGDATEVSVLARTFAGQRGPIWLGSVKSNIGHLKSAAGAAGLLKAVLALRSGIVPPTLHAGPVHPDLGLDRTPFLLPRLPVAVPPDRPRASVSAFGFGGTNYHVLLEAPASGPAPTAAADLRRHGAPLLAPAGTAAWGRQDAAPVLLAFGARSPGALVRAVRDDRPGAPDEVAAAPHRLVVLAEPGTEGRAAAIRRAAEWLRAGARDPVPAQVFAGSGPARPVVVAFPGQGAQRIGGLAAVRRVPAGARAVAALEAALAGSEAGGEALAAREGRGGRPSREPLDVHLVLYAIGVGWAAVVLEAAGIPVAATVGHSLGGLAALVAAGAAPAEALLPVAIARGAALAACPPGAMVAVRAAEAEAEALARRYGLEVAAVNGPDQAVLSGASDAVDAVVARLGPARARTLDVARAYHAASVAPAADAVRRAMARVPLEAPRRPVWSARTGTEIPAAEAAEDLAAAVVEPVRFDRAARGLCAAGHVLWVEAGPGTALSRMATAAGATAIPLDPGPDRGLAEAAAALVAAGHPGLARILPATVMAQALPEPPAPRHTRTRPAPAGLGPARAVAAPWPADRWRADAAKVVDLRIAALADPSLAPAYEAARAALVRALADADAAAISGVAAAQEVGAVEAEAPAVRAAPDGASPPVDPAPPPAPSAGAGEGSARDDLRAGVVEVICEVTGYPPEAVAAGADLEADLGVDSIRKMEILGTLEKRFGFASTDADYALLAEADLDALVAHVRRRLAPDAPAGTDPASDPAPAGGEGAGTIAVLVRRRLTDAPERRAPPPHVLRIPPDTDPAEVVRQLAAGLPGTGDEPLAAVVPVDPGGAVAAGWLRAAARELGRPLRLVHTVGVVCRERIAAELGSARPPETWIDADGAWTEVAVPADPAPRAAWPERPVVLATGGVRGVVVPCLRALADRRPRVLLVGRTPQGDPAVAGALATLQDAGVEADYFRADVTDPAAVRAAADAARARWSRIDVVLHAAGIVRDGPLGRVSAADLAAVLAVKWDGARHLIDATRDDPLTWFCTFSSLVSRLGNPAQAGYAAANAAMEALTHPAAARTTHLLWTAWSELGMAADPRLQALLAARGVAPIPPAVGAALFRRIADAGGDGRVLVTGSPPPTRGPLEVAPLPWPLGAPDHLDVPPLSFTIPLDPDQPALSDHRVAGRPLVPAALWLAALIEAARAASGLDGPWAVEAMAITGPVFVDRPRRDVRLRLEPEGAGWRATIEAAGAAVCRARIAASAPPAPNGGPPRPLVDPEPARDLYRPDLLFHGPAWQVLRHLRTDAARAEADYRPAPASLAGPTAVASVVDGAHQLLAAWSGRAVGWLGLPVGADRWVADGRPEGVVRIEALASTGGQELTAEVVALDADGRVVLRGEGVRLRAARSGGADA